MGKMARCFCIWQPQDVLVHDHDPVHLSDQDPLILILQARCHVDLEHAMCLLSLSFDALDNENFTDNGRNSTCYKKLNSKQT